MLMDVLAAVASGGHGKVSDIARELGTAKAMIEQALMELVQKGYLRRLCGGGKGHCGACATCPMSGDPFCSGGDGVDCWTVVWELTAKGRRALEKRGGVA